MLRRGRQPHPHQRRRLWLRDRRLRAVRRLSLRHDGHGWRACWPCGGIASAFAGTIGSVLPVAAGGLGRAVVILAAIGGITAVNLRGVRGGAGLVSVSTAIKLIPLLMFVALGVFAAPGQGCRSRCPACP